MNMRQRYKRFEQTRTADVVGMILLLGCLYIGFMALWSLPEPQERGMVVAQGGR